MFRYLRPYRKLHIFNARDIANSQFKHGFIKIREKGKERKKVLGPETEKNLEKSVARRKIRGT